MLLFYLLPIFPKILQPQDSDQYQSQLRPKSYIAYTRIRASVYQHVNKPAVSLPIKRVRGVVMMFRCWNIVLLTTKFFDVAKFTILKPLSLLSWCRLSFPIVGLKISSHPNFALNSHNTIFIWYL